jgi:hypothetical protein
MKYEIISDSQKFIDNITNSWILKSNDSQLNSKDKNPLNYQVGDYDCVPTTFINAITFLIGRTEYRPEILKKIETHTLDIPYYRIITQKGTTRRGPPPKNIPKENKIKEIGSGGTSSRSVQELVKELDLYHKQNFDPFRCEYVDKAKITSQKMIKALDSGAVVIVDVRLGNEGHYVLITKIKGNEVYLFDPYYQEKSAIKDKEIKVITDHPFEYNRMIPLTRLFAEGKKDYMMGKKEHREMILIWKQIEN